MRPATIEDASAVHALLERSRRADGRPALSEFKELRVPVANAIRSLVADGPGDAVLVVAVAAWHPVDVGEDDGYWAAEIAVDPDHRTTQAYVAALEALAAELDERPSFWAFSEQQEEAAVQHGLTEVRAIVEMRRKLPADAAELPPSLAVRPFAPGDEGLWLALNQQVFAHHPEAGAIDRADLALRMAQPWFDANGLLILEEAGEPIGYCWTKMHGATEGEIYMIGLVPQARGRRLAKPLTRVGLAHLSGRGATEALLYAEADNHAAVGLYRSMGFEVARRLALYADGPT